VTGAVQRILSFPVCDFVPPTGRGRLAVVGAYIAGEGCNSRRILYTTDGGNTWGSHYAWGGWSFQGPVSLNGNLVGLTMQRWNGAWINAKYFHVVFLLRPDGQVVANASTPFYNVEAFWGTFAHGSLSDGRMAATVQAGDGQHKRATTTTPEASDSWFVEDVPNSMFNRPVRIFRSGGADFAIGPYGGYCGHDGMYTRLNSSWFDTYVVTCIYPLRQFWTTEDFR
jgi:hypothetical protein